MIIDFHTHIFTHGVKERREEYCSHDACFGMLYSKPNAKLCTAEELLNGMDERGIAKSVILNIGWVSHELCIKSNDYILESAAKYPGRLIGFCSIQPSDPENALKELDRCRQAGAKGIGELRPDVQGFDLRNTGLMRPLVDYASENNMTMLLHSSEPVGHEYAGKGSVSPASLYGFVSSYPELKVVLAHLGGGLAFYESMPEVARSLSNTFYDTAAAPFLYRSEVYNALMSITGSKKLLFGSDWPLMDPVKVVTHIESANLSEAEKQDILHLNAERLLSA